MKQLIYGALTLAVFGMFAGCRKTAPEAAEPEFVTVRDGQFYIGDSVYRYIGTSFPGYRAPTTDSESWIPTKTDITRSEEHTSELQSRI